MAVNRHSALRKCRNAVSAGVLSPISSAAGRNGAVGDKESARAGARNYPRWRQIMRLRYCAATPHPPPSGAPSPQGEGLRVRHSHREPLKGKANGGVSFNTATHQGGRLTPAGGGRKKDRRGRSFCVFLGCAAHCALLCSFWSMAVNSGGRGQWSSTGSPVRGWTKRRPVAWRHWPVRPGTGFLAP